MRVESKRLQVLEISPELLAAMLKPLGITEKWHQVVEDTIPENCRLVRTYLDKGIIHLVLEDDSFPEVPDGKRIPFLKPPLISTIFEKQERVPE